MTGISEEWDYYSKRKANFGKRLSIAGVVLLVLGICLIFFRKYQHSLYYWIPLFLVIGLILFMAGVNINLKAALPTDVVGVPATAIPNPIIQGQIIQSKSYFSFKSLLRTIGILGLCLGFLIYLANSGHLPVNPRGGAFIFLLVMLIMSLLICLGIILSIVVSTPNHTRIVIKGSDKTISFINLFTKKTRSYPFNDLDGFVSVYYLISTRSGPKKVYILYLVRQGIRIEKIASDAYMNFAALQSGLGSLKQSKFTDTMPIKL